MSTKMKTKKRATRSKLGNAGCTRCGLRASSKNVAIRHVFPCWPDDDNMLECMEHAMKIHMDKEGNQYFRILRNDGQTYAQAFTMFFKLVRNHNPKQFEANLEKMFCLHTWEQDKGTATV